MMQTILHCHILSALIKNLSNMKQKTNIPKMHFTD